MHAVRSPHRTTSTRPPPYPDRLYTNVLPPVLQKVAEHAPALLSWLDRCADLGLTPDEVAAISMKPAAAISGFGAAATHPQLLAQLPCQQGLTPDALANLSHQRAAAFSGFGLAGTPRFGAATQAAPLALGAPCRPWRTHPRR